MANRSKETSIGEDPSKNFGYPFSKAQSPYGFDGDPQETVRQVYGSPNPARAKIAHSKNPYRETPFREYPL